MKTPKTPQEIVRMFRIELSDFRPGNHKTRCPRCSDTRKHKKDRCLSVKIDSAGVTWNCYNCGWRPDEGFLCSSDAPTPGGSRLIQNRYGAQGHPSTFPRTETKSEAYKRLLQASKAHWRA